MENLSTLILASFLRGGRRLVFLAICSGVLIFGMVYVLPAKMWEVAGGVRIGQSPTMASELFEPVLLMSLDSTLELIRHEALAVGEKVVPSGEKWTFKLRPVSGGLLDLRVTAPSVQMAAEIHGALLARLKESHDEIFRQRQGLMLKEEARLALDMEVGRRIWAEQRSLCGTFAVKATEGRLLCANLLANEGARQDRQGRLHARVQEMLLSSWTYPTAQFGELTLSKEPVSPNLLLSLALSFLGGLASMVSLAFVGAVRQHARMFKERN